jgi:hypothetical protein
VKAVGLFCMPNSNTTRTGDGATTIFTFSFGYLDRSHITAEVNGVEAEYLWVNASSIQITPAPAIGAVVFIKRTTPTEPITDFTDGQTLTADELDKINLQSVYLFEELADSQGTTLSQSTDGNYDAGGARIKNVGTPTAGPDAATKDYVDTGVSSGVAQATAAAANAQAAALTATTRAGEAALDRIAAEEAAGDAGAAAIAAQAAADSIGVGPEGPIGLTGPQGPQGLKGDTGATGPQGPQGPQGLTGPAGAVGPQGPQGLTGPAGAVGPQGPQGLKGDTGDTGPQGPTGATGPQGPTGATGPQGPQGPAGADGSGVVPTIATEADAESATSNTVIMTPLRHFNAKQTRLIGDWEDARDNGWYQAHDAIGAPVSGWLIGYVSRYKGSYPFWTQTVWNFTAEDGHIVNKWTRMLINGSFTPWVRVIDVLATEDQAEAGTDNNRVMTPLRTKQAIAADRVATSPHAYLEDTWVNTSPGVTDATAALQAAVNNPANAGKYIVVTRNIRMKQGVLVTPSSWAKGVIFENGSICYIDFNGSDGFRNTDASVQFTTTSAAFLVLGTDNYGTPVDHFRVENLKAIGVNITDAAPRKFDAVVARNVKDFEFVNGIGMTLTTGYLVVVDSLRGKSFIKGAWLQNCTPSGPLNNNSNARAQISTVMVDRTRMTNAAGTAVYNSEPMVLEDIVGINLRQYGTQLTQCVTQQSDVLTLVGDGIGRHTCRRIHGEYVDEVLDVQTDSNNFYDVKGYQLTGALLKIFNGASYNKVYGADVDGWRNRVVQWGAQTNTGGWNGAKSCQHNQIHGLTIRNCLGDGDDSYTAVVKTFGNASYHCVNNVIYGMQLITDSGIDYIVDNATYASKNRIEFTEVPAPSAFTFQRLGYGHTFSLVHSDLVVAHRSASHNLDPGWEKVQLDVVYEDRYDNFLEGGTVSTQGVYRCRIPGFYQVDAKLRLADVREGTFAVRANGSTQLLTESDHFAKGEWHVSGPVWLEAGDTLEMAFFNAGAAIGFTALRDYTYLRIQGPI